jgi:hypothetical protein
MQDTSQADSIFVAHVDGGTTAFLVDTNILKSDWQNYLNTQSGLSGISLSHVEIIYQNNLYYVRAYGTMGSNALASTMNTHTSGSGPVCIIIGGSNQLTITCTTTDCSSEPLGCVPLVTSCSPCSNHGKCTRTTTNNISVIFPNIPPNSCM